MICGIGTDIVNITRFHSWVDYPQERLLKIFSAQELVDCSTVPLASIRQAQGERILNPFVVSEALAESNPYEPAILIPEKLAARFAAKEAFFKALSATLERKGLTQKEFSLSFICHTVSVTQTPWGAPQLAIDWQIISKKIDHSLPTLSTHLSLSHDGSIALAFVVIED